MRHEEYRNEIFAGMTLRENLRDIVARTCTGYGYDDLVTMVADPNNEDGLGPEEVTEVDQTVNLLGHLFLYELAPHRLKDFKAGVAFGFPQPGMHGPSSEAIEAAFIDYVAKSGNL